MGGSVDVVTSALQLMTTGTYSSSKKADSGNYEQLKAEREQQEAQLAKTQADERKRRRAALIMAREKERNRQADTAPGNTTLINGGAGLTDDPEVAQLELKDKFGE